jgi:hypothetical protein
VSSDRPDVTVDDAVDEPLPPIPKTGLRAYLREYFVLEEPTLGLALVPMCFLSMLLFTRHPLRTNFIFDEQEALLANPYVRAGFSGSKIGWLEAFRRDFWGLTPERTIGSYRPLPDIVWRALWSVGARDQSPFVHHWVNVLLHGLNGALMVLLVWKLTKSRPTSWFAGAFFVASAVVTEAVSGVVGLADVLGGTGALLALLALTTRAWAMPFAVFGATLVGLYSKESALCIVPLVPLAALFFSNRFHPELPMRWPRALLALMATLGAFVFYVELRRRLFPVVLPAELSEETIRGLPPARQVFAKLLRWYAQPGLPRDPLNNPLILASPEYRIAGAMRVYARGLGQVLVPWTLSGDYSSPQEPIPERLVFPESVLGALAFVGPVVATPVLGVWAWLRSRTRGTEAGADPLALIGFAWAWVVVSYFPVSNIPVLLPTVRAERFWYFPLVGTSLLLALWAVTLLSVVPRRISLVLLGIYLGFQCGAARRHAFDYTDDLVFWDATRHAVPRSAKAHLNYSVMVGARGDMEGRLAANQIAFALAPKWPMASVYLGDTLCRMHRVQEAIPHYLRGFDLGPGDMHLIALGVQCLWDEGQLKAESDLWTPLREIADRHVGSWVKYIVDDTRWNGEEHHGVDPKHRPRGYNEGPKTE